MISRFDEKSIIITIKTGRPVHLQDFLFDLITSFDSSGLFDTTAENASGGRKNLLSGNALWMSLFATQLAGLGSDLALKVGPDGSESLRRA